MGPALYTRRRWVVPGRRLTSTTELLKQCNYLSVQQMVHYHSVALVHKVLVHQAPVHLYHIVSRALASGVRHLYDTRAACWRDVAPARLAAANTSWRWRPTALRKEESLVAFLPVLRRHTVMTVAI